MSSITHKDLDKLSKEQLIELCLRLSDSTDPLIKSMKGYTKAINDISDLLINNNIVDDIVEYEDTEESDKRSEKAEKVWSKAKVIMEKMTLYQESLLKMQALLMPSISQDESIVREAPEGDITRFIE